MFEETVTLLRKCSARELEIIYHILLAMKNPEV